MKKLEFYEFSEFWSEYVNEQIKGEELKKIWNKDSRWTELIMSDELQKKLAKEFNCVSEDRIWKEWKKFDLVIGTDDLFEGIYNYDLSKVFTKKDDFGSYPRHQLLLLEHENKFQTCLNEIFKLTYERARTKVLITYPYTIGHRLAILNNITNILDQSDTSLSELSEYIVIFGEYIDDILYWLFYEIGYNGVIVNSHFFTNTGDYKSIEDLIVDDFRYHHIWRDHKTVDFNSMENSITRKSAVIPCINKTDTIIHNSSPLFNNKEPDYYEQYFVYTVFNSENSSHSYEGYVWVDMDYNFRQGKSFETHMNPVIFKHNIQVPFWVRHENKLAEKYELFNLTPEELFPLKYEIKADVNGFPKEGVIPGFIKGDTFIT